MFLRKLMYRLAVNITERPTWMQQQHFLRLWLLCMLSSGCSVLPASHGYFLLSERVYRPYQTLSEFVLGTWCMWNRFSECPWLSVCWICRFLCTICWVGACVCMFVCVQQEALCFVLSAVWGRFKLSNLDLAPDAQSLFASWSQFSSYNRTQTNNCFYPTQH